MTQKHANNLFLGTNNIGASAMEEQDPLAHLQGSGFYQYTAIIG